MMTLLLWVMVASLLAGLLLGRPYIDWMVRWRMGQVVRTEGPQTHQRKAGTPSMGGWLLLAPPLLAPAVVGRMDDATTLLVLVVLGFTLLGWLDDFLIVKRQSNRGLAPRKKLLGQFCVAIFFVAGLMYLGHATQVRLPFSGGMALVDLGWLYYGLVTVLMVGSANAVNLTDGLDGLATGTSFIAMLALLALLILVGVSEGVLVVLFAALGAAAAFMWYNGHPAQIFMGDTGSLGLGALLGGASVLGHLELSLIVFGAVFVVETVSVMAQVTYFRLTGGKRLLRMSPIHHHFELGGMPETCVVTRFWLAGLVVALLAVLCF